MSTPTLSLLRPDQMSRRKNTSAKLTKEICTMGFWRFWGELLMTFLTKLIAFLTKLMETDETTRPNSSAQPSSPLFNEPPRKVMSGERVSLRAARATQQANHDHSIFSWVFHQYFHGRAFAYMGE